MIRVVSCDGVRSELCSCCSINYDTHKDIIMHNVGAGVQTLAGLVAAKCCLVRTNSLAVLQ